MILFFNGVVSFAYTAANTAEPSTTWAMLATTFVFFLGLSQTGIVFSAFMRIAKSEWGKYFSRLGEILTLSFIPVAFITFIIIYIGGTDHLFWWAHPETMQAGVHGGEHGAHLSPWLGKGPFLWRGLVSMALFYAMSWIYFSTGRIEERGRAPYDIEKRLNVMASFVMVFYILTNTNTAWDFGMTIIPHWESTIFPPYYWVGNVFAGVAFLFIIGNYFVFHGTGRSLDKQTKDFMGIMLLGFTLLWIYMFWSQHIVLWYSDLPNLSGPFFKTMTGSWSIIFAAMIVAVFIVPFFALIYRKIKLCITALTVVSVIICIGVWINRYLMIIPVFSDGTKPVFLSWTGIGLILGGLAATILPVIFYLKLFPHVTVTTHEGGEGHH